MEPQHSLSKLSPESAILLSGAGQEAPREAQERLRTAEQAPRAGQERPGEAQDRPKSGPRVAKTGSRATQDRPRDSPRRARSGPRGQRRPQRLPGESTWANLGPTSANLERFWAARPCFSHCQLDLPAATLEKLAAQARVGDRSFSTLGLVRRRTANQGVLIHVRTDRQFLDLT